jgi:predicted AlkP superfamily pyrophosphatase or phosphodiesterase
MNKLHQQFNKILKDSKHDRNETVHRVQKHFWTRRGFLKQAVIGVSVVAISLFGHSLLKPEQTIANPSQGSMATKALPGRARLIIVFILDGLRPDSINPQDTPNLFRLRAEGVNYVNGHAVFPTVTRVNATAIGTGYYPGTNGIVSNSIYVPQVNPTRAFSTGEYENLLRLDEVSGGRMVLVKSLGERLQENGMKLAAVSSGSTGSALLLNPRAVNGVGVLINGDFEPGKLVAYPSNVNDTILTRFGAAPVKDGDADDQYNESVDWTEQVMREYVIPELKPDVILNWLTEPDHTQHATGAGSPESINTIRNDDRNIGLVLEKLKSLGLEDKTDIFVISDHGFSLETFALNVTQELINAGLKAGQDSDDVVVASSGQSILLHVENRDPKRIRETVKFLQAQSWAGVIFTAGNKPSSDFQNTSVRPRQDNRRAINADGSVTGTFSLELIHEFNSERGPDILFTFPWTSDKNAFGVPGTDFTDTSGATGSLTTNASGHGSMSPWNVRNTFFAWGVDFKRGVEVKAPASNVDLTPTILALKGINTNEPFDGRVLLEGLKGGPDERYVHVRTHVFTTNANQGRYKAAIQVSEVGNQLYVDQSSRLP